MYLGGDVLLHGALHARHAHHGSAAHGVLLRLLAQQELALEVVHHGQWEPLAGAGAGGTLQRRGEERRGEEGGERRGEGRSLPPPLQTEGLAFQTRARLSIINSLQASVYDTS